MDLVDGAVPTAQLEDAVERIRRDPPHPGSHIRGVCERKSITIPEVARQIGVDVVALTLVVDGLAPVSPDLAFSVHSRGRHSRRMARVGASSLRGASAAVRCFSGALGWGTDG